MTSSPPAHCKVVSCSPKSKYAKILAPTGSPKMFIETVVADTYCSNQLNKIWPNTVGTTANNTKIPHSLAG